MVKIKEVASKNRMLFSALGAFMTFVLVWVGVYYLTQEKKQVVIMRGQLASLERDLNLLDRVLADTEDKKEEIDFAMRTLPSSFSEVSFAVGQFERLALENSQSLEIELDTSIKEEAGATDSLKTLLRTTGNYSSFSEMMSQLAILPYHTRVDSLKLEDSAEGLLGLTSFRLYLPDDEK